MIKQDSTVYDFVFVTHLPSFYKTNLYNELSKKYNVFVIFIGSGSTARTNDFTAQAKSFHYMILNTGAFEQRSRLKSIMALLQYLRKIKFHQLILGGWELPEFWALALWGSRENNYLALESSIFESKTTGFRQFIKKVFLMRVKGVYYSGEPHLRLLEALSYQGIKIKTGGVGLMHMPSVDHRLPGREKIERKPSKFLYVGRLSPEKNLELIINYFTKMPHYQLTIVGDGPLREHLMKNNSKNIQFVGHVPNHKLIETYQSHDVFVLPSLKEPWGLVVEEALYHGLPVIASHQVGARQDMIDFYDVGRCFDPLSESSLHEAVEWLNTNFSKAQANTRGIDFLQRATFQINSYAVGLSKHA